ncbi:MAG: DUF3604 domain-containing protein [Hyphomicrobiales bacterium]
MQHFDLGGARIEPPEPVVAGCYTTLTFTYTAGHPIDDTGFVKLAFRFASDFGTPQFDSPQLPNYCSVATTGDCRIEYRWDPKGHTRPWGRSLFLKVMGGFLDRGQTITVVFGDRSAGSPGWQMQTFCEESFEFKTLVDPIATYEFKELPQSPTLRIVAGRPARAVCIAPSEVLLGEGFTYHLKLEDRWGNPTALPVPLNHPGLNRAGFSRLTATDETTGLSAASNPVLVSDGAVRLRRCWADLHGQSEETIGTNSIEDYFRFARDYARVDACGHQGNDFQVTDDFWKTIDKTTRKYYKPNRFVTFPGYEWSGNTPLGGDRNVYFTSEGGRITRSCTDLLPGKTSIYRDSPTAVRLFENLNRSKGPQPFVFAHVGGRYADMRIHDPEVEIAVEVHSAWGTFEWLVDDALSRGYRIGICANSDDHKGRPGASYPGAGRFGSLGGLTCILTRRLDRQHLYDALRSRHFYATTGNRSLVDVRVIMADNRQAMMGDIVEAGSGTPVLHVDVAGTAPVERVIIRNGLKTVQVLRPYSREDLGRRIKILWSGAEVRGRARMTSWDGHLQVTGNRILDAVPINFWNANRPIVKTGENRLAWTSVTTGGVAGMILTLESPREGSISLKTAQRSVRLAVRSAGLDPRTWACGGLCKKIEICRLPDQPPPQEFSFSIPLPGLARGDNPVFICMVQEDGHMAWTSPVYLVKGGLKASSSDRKKRPRFPF